MWILGTSPVLQGLQVLEHYFLNERASNDGIYLPPPPVSSPWAGVHEPRDTKVLTQGTLALRRSAPSNIPKGKWSHTEGAQLYILQVYE